MAAVATKAVAGQVLKSNRPERGNQDPYHETYQHRTMGINRTKKRKRQPPPYLNATETEVLKKVRKRAYSLDMSLFNLFGLRFGWGSVIGLIPALGDVLDALMALMVILKCCSVEPKLPGSVVSTMYINLVLDFLVGLVPLLGDLADAAYKCNTKNYVLLETELKKRSDERSRAKGKVPNPDDGVGLMEQEVELAENPEMSMVDDSPPQYAAHREPRAPQQTYNPSASRSRRPPEDVV